jgi:hypothetical protein
MPKVKVYKYKKWGQSAVAPKMATREFIAKAKGTIVEGSEREVQGGELDHNGQARIGSS